MGAAALADRRRGHGTAWGKRGVTLRPYISLLHVLRRLNIYGNPANASRMVVGMSCTTPIENPEQCNANRLRFSDIPRQRMDRIVTIAQIGERCSAPNQSHCNAQMQQHGRQHRLYTYARSICKKEHVSKWFKNVPFTRSHSATGLFTIDGMRSLFVDYIFRLVAWMRVHMHRC